jgi:prepilin-type N-terminal cleavage/methylation domain-containing protein
MRPHLTVTKQTARGFSITELILALAMISVVAGFAVISLARRNRAVSRTSTAVDIANYLQKARLDSIRRRAKDVDQMAQVKFFDRHSYSLTIDGDNDGYLDVPLIMSLPEQPGVEINGPFPKTFIFDWQGQTVDLQNHRVASAPMTIGNSSGASAIKFSDDGTITVVPAVKLMAQNSR